MAKLPLYFGYSITPLTLGLRPIEALENVGSLVKITGASFALPALPSTAVELVMPHASWHSQSLSLDQLLDGPATRWHLGDVPNGVGQWISNHLEPGSTDKVILLELGSSGSLTRTALGSLSCPVTRKIKAILNKTGWPDTLFFLR
jgi:hypothetical protein